MVSAWRPISSRVSVAVVVSVNGAAARKVQVGDTVIIIAYAIMDFEEAKTFKPTVIFPKEGNRL